MTNKQLYLAIGVPSFAAFLGMLTNIVTLFRQSRSLEKRLDLNKDLILESLKAFRIETPGELRQLETKVDSQMELHIVKMHN